MITPYMEIGLKGTDKSSEKLSCMKEILNIIIIIRRKCRCSITSSVRKEYIIQGSTLPVCSSFRVVTINVSCHMGITGPLLNSQRLSIL